MSVQACTVNPHATSRAYRFRVVITCSTDRAASGEASLAFTAVLITPTPRGFVSTSTSPGRALQFFQILSGWTKPLTLRPYFGVLSRIVWPPAITAPASRILEAPPSRIFFRIPVSRPEGNAAMFSATFGSPPMA